MKYLVLLLTAIYFISISALAKTQQVDFTQNQKNIEKLENSFDGKIGVYSIDTNDHQNFFKKNKEVINSISSILSAIGTIGAVIVALWLSYKDSKPKLKIFATVGSIFPENSTHLWISCINVSKQSIMCTGFALKTNKYSKKNYILPNPIYELKFDRPRPGRILQFSENCEQHFEETTLKDSKVKIFLGNYKLIAWIRLKFLWKIIATTNIQEFQGNLSNDLIKRILFLHFHSTKSQVDFQKESNPA